jgi:hypothetical protein
VLILPQSFSYEYKKNQQNQQYRGNKKTAKKKEFFKKVFFRKKIYIKPSEVILDTRSLGF